MELLSKIEQVSKDIEINPTMLAATVIAESNLNPYIHRPEPAFWRAYMKADSKNWEAQYRAMYPTMSDEPIPEELLIHTFSASYGLCQLMYTTAIKNGFAGKPHELFDPTKNLYAGARYLAHLYSRYPEIRSSEIERMKFTIAAYNAGRGNINKMLRLARAAEHKSIKQDGMWQYWDEASKYLSQVTGSSAEITQRHISRICDILKRH